jgi:Flp pilus assembly pilin Flp
MNRIATATTIALLAAVGRLRDRVRDESGQTAAEYLGIVAVIAVIIGILATSQIGETLRTNIVDLIDEIFAGGR